MPGSKDIRIEAALAKLWSSEMAWRIADELVQIRGGRGYETAESLAARGERAVPAEQVLRDMRINRIFEGSTEIMHLLIAREAVDAHLKAAGDLANADADLRDKARAAVGASGFYAKWLPQLVAGKGTVPTGYSEFGPLATHLRFVERSSRKLARHTFYGMSRWQAGLEHRQSFLGRIVDIGAELFAMAAACTRAEMLRRSEPAQAKGAVELADTLSPVSAAGRDALRAAVEQQRRGRHRLGWPGSGRVLHLARRGRPRPVGGHWPLDLDVVGRTKRPRVGLALLPLTRWARSLSPPGRPSPVVGDSGAFVEAPEDAVRLVQAISRVELVPSGRVDAGGRLDDSNAQAARPRSAEQEPRDPQPCWSEP